MHRRVANQSRNPLLSQPKLRRGKFQVPQHAQHDFGSWALCPFDACRTARPARPASHGGVKGPAGVAPRPFPAFFLGAPSSYTMDCSWNFLIPVLAALGALLAKIWHIVFPHDSWLINFPDLLNCSSTCTHCCHCLDSNYQSATELLGIGELFQPLSANYKSPTWDKPVGSFPGLPPLLSILVRSGSLGPQWFGGSQPCPTWKSLVFSWICIPFTKKQSKKGFVQDLDDVFPHDISEP